MDGHCIDDEDLQLPNQEWKPSEWIGCGKAYNLKDLPRHVAIQLERARIVPPHIQSILPSEALSPAAFYAHTDVPAWYESADKQDIFEAVSDEEDEPSGEPIQRENSRKLRDRLEPSEIVGTVKATLQFMKSQGLDLVIFLDALCWGDEACHSDKAGKADQRHSPLPVRSEKYIIVY
ncbi:hypothetical protein GGX14DRAFT_565845 [Mycena pura]|uniref:Uncharacterized protein n=1 Tax=Mycena pura TaxID=153505 RepID=A0AAD6VDW6_9AGAR|nr:hypothetical protein GGX14DRAFT_565845 [Mycena pura]